MIQDLCQNFNILACHSPVLMQKAAVHLRRPLRKLVLGIDLYRVRKDPVRKIQTAVRMRPPAKLLIDPLLLKLIRRQPYINFLLKSPACNFLPYNIFSIAD